MRLNLGESKRLKISTEWENTMEQFITYIDEVTAKLQQEERELAATDRKDESNLVKVRINVYGICKTLFEVARKLNTSEGLKEDYLKRLTTLSENWKISYEKAKTHNDVEKVVIEELKLGTLDEVKNKFMEFWETK